VFKSWAVGAIVQTTGTPDAPDTLWTTWTRTKSVSCLPLFSSFSTGPSPSEVNYRLSHFSILLRAGPPLHLSRLTCSPYLRLHPRSALGRSSVTFGPDATRTASLSTNDSAGSRTGSARRQKQSAAGPEFRDELETRGLGMRELWFTLREDATRRPYDGHARALDDHDRGPAHILRALMAW
jgi:hypothetical protein